MNFEIKFNASSEILHEIKQLNHRLGLVIGPPGVPLLPTSPTTIINSSSANPIVAQFARRMILPRPPPLSAGRLLFTSGEIPVGAIGQTIFRNQNIRHLKF
ncbi:Uncharacterized protein Adt_35681 [Abeliophyllum distichum]|uniref:Uncharacterized protein n=1 Tax=Abeliophyllum distichum TaxID=126358 RepID=A0ABD1QFF3_9LAMI